MPHVGLSEMGQTIHSWQDAPADRNSEVLTHRRDPNFFSNPKFFRIQ
jgi:hypothetical protein